MSPAANSQPSYVRVDAVHQSAHDGAKGVYHINAVDDVIQFQFVGTVETISERFLLHIRRVPAPAHGCQGRISHAGAQKPAYCSHGEPRQRVNASTTW